MAHTFVKVDVHIVFHTKLNRIPMREEDLPLIHKYIGGIIKNIQSVPICIGGVSNHVHILCSLPKTMSLADFVRTIKANSSRWIRSLDSHYYNFAWQTGYGAFSVSLSNIGKTVRYIRNQAQHHMIVSADKEDMAFLKAYDVDFTPDYLPD